MFRSEVESSEVGSEGQLVLQGFGVAGFGGAINGNLSFEASQLLLHELEADHLGLGRFRKIVGVVLGAVDRDGGHGCGERPCNLKGKGGWGPTVGNRTSGT